jgi:hypothetical protein
MAVYCFACGVEVPESQKVVRRGRVFCSKDHSWTTKYTAAPPQVKQAAQPAPAQTVGGPKPAEAAKPVPPEIKQAAQPAPAQTVGGLKPTEAAKPVPPEIKQAAQPAPVQTVGGPKPTEAAKPVATKPPSA